MQKILRVSQEVSANQGQTRFTENENQSSLSIYRKKKKNSTAQNYLGGRVVKGNNSDTNSNPHKLINSKTK